VVPAKPAPGPRFGAAGNPWGGDLIETGASYAVRGRRSRGIAANTRLTEVLLMPCPPPLTPPLQGGER
jgi:hypothetical protein